MNRSSDLRSHFASSATAAAYFGAMLGASEVSAA